MDTAKIGNFIKELRKEKGFTQKELAEKLHITDRAVSKWERGLSAPDLALLEPLSEIFDVTIGELIYGQRDENRIDSASDTVIKELILFSYNEIKNKFSFMKKKFYIRVLLCFFLAIILFLFAVQINGNGFGIDCIPAYLHLHKTTNAIENYNEKKINKYIYRAKEKEVYNNLIALKEEGIEILDRDAELSGTRLDDGFMFTRASIVIRYDGVTYMVYFKGTYRNGKTELIHTEEIYAELPDCIAKLQKALCTYNPG